MEDWVLEQVRKNYDEANSERKKLYDRYERGELDWNAMNRRYATLTGECSAYAHVIGLLGGTL